MKRLIAGVAIAAAAAFLTAAPAQAAAAAAAPANPVKALQKQFVTGKGMKFTERTTLISGSLRDILVRRSGSFMFGKSGIAASDITGKFNIQLSDLPEDAPPILTAMATPERTIRIGRTVYISGGVFSALMPEGETWWKSTTGPAGGFTGVYGQPINVAEPKTLAAVLKTAKPGAGRTLSGSIAYGELYKVSPWLRASSMNKPSAKSAKLLVSWRLTLNGKSLAERLVTTFPGKVLDSSASSKESVSIDSRYTGWGSTVSITAPDDVTSQLDGDPTDLPIIGDGVRP